MTDEELVDYIDAHSHTERALVSNEMVTRLLELSGDQMPDHLKNQSFIACHSYNVKDIIARARRRMRLKVVK